MSFDSRNSDSTKRSSRDDKYTRMPPRRHTERHGIRFSLENTQHQYPRERTRVVDSPRGSGSGESSGSGSRRGSDEVLEAGPSPKSSMSTRRGPPVTARLEQMQMPQHQRPERPHHRQQTMPIMRPPPPSAREEPKAFTTRLTDAFHRLAKEPSFESPPPSGAPSRRNSIGFDPRPLYPRPGDHMGWDIMPIAMDMNRDRVYDYDDPVLDEPAARPADEPVLPCYVNNVIHRRRPSEGCHRPGYDRRRSSYRERRKQKKKHLIEYNVDTSENQQRFIIVLAKALLVFGSPSHRIEPMLDSVASVFGLEAQFSHTPGVIQISFGNPESGGSETVFIKGVVALDLKRIHDTHEIYRLVVRDEISASEGTRMIEKLLSKPPLYGPKLQWAGTFVLGCLLCVVSFGGSLNDMWVSGLLSLVVAWVEAKSARTGLSASGTDIFAAAGVSFVARLLATKVPNQIFCYEAISSTSIAGLLPGSLLLGGVLDIASRNVMLGAPKIVGGILTSLYLGFGLTLGSDVWLRIDTPARRLLDSQTVVQYLDGNFMAENATTAVADAFANLTGVFTFTKESTSLVLNINNNCYRDPSWGWYLQPLPWWTLFFTLPVFNFILSMKRGQPLRSVSTIVMVAISCASFAVQKASNLKMGLGSHPDYNALLGSFVVSTLGNLWARRFGGTAFTLMLTGIWLLIPSGLAQAGGLADTYTSPGQDEYTSSLDLARKMIEVIIGVMSGVYLSARIIYTFGKKKNNALVTF